MTTKMLFLLGLFLVCSCLVVDNPKKEQNTKKNNNTIGTRSSCSAPCKENEICSHGICVSKNTETPITSTVTAENSKLQCITSTVSYSFPSIKDSTCFQPPPSCSDKGVCTLCAKPCAGELYQECDTLQIPGFEAIERHCTDTLDNDCNGFVDCADTECKSYWRCQHPGCSIPEGADASFQTLETFCEDTLDNDCDGFVDCTDSDCSAFPLCCKDDPACTQEGISCNANSVLTCTRSASGCLVKTEQVCDKTCDNGACLDCTCNDCACNAVNTCLDQGVQSTRVGINFEDYEDMDFNDAVMCFTGAFSVVNKRVVSLSDQTVTAKFLNTSACGHQLEISVTHVEHCGTGGYSDSMTVNTGSPPINIQFKKGSQLDVTMINLSDCAASIVGKRVHMSDAKGEVKPDHCKE